VVGDGEWSSPVSSAWVIISSGRVEKTSTLSGITGGSQWLDRGQN
jgi:hypothetical protein